jgi:hypothetical protein
VAAAICEGALQTFLMGKVLFTMHFADYAAGNSGGGMWAEFPRPWALVNEAQLQAVLAAGLDAVGLQCGAAQAAVWLPSPLSLW